MWESWIESYGYLAVFVGSIVEGETVLIMAGYAISRGFLEPAPTFLLAAAGGALGDLAYFLIGRRYGAVAMRRFGFLRPLRARAVLLTRRWGKLSAFLLRFAYGLRVVLPLTLGAARLRLPVFLGFNLLGAFAFAAVYLTLGRLFGEAIEEVLARIRFPDRWVLLALLGFGALVWAVREWRLYHDTPPEEPPESE